MWRNISHCICPFNLLYEIRAISTLDPWIQIIGMVEELEMIQVHFTKGASDQRILNERKISMTSYMAPSG
jgi:hypothetical protein